MVKMAQMANMIKRTQHGQKDQHGQKEQTDQKRKEGKMEQNNKKAKKQYLDSGCKNVDQLNLQEVAYLNVQALEQAQPVHGGTYWHSLEGRGGRPVGGSKLSPSPYADALVLGYIDKNGTISDAQGAFVALKNGGIASSKQH